jgi:hypothetical protein
LEPLLFFVYTTDLPTKLNCDPLLCADGKTLLAIANNYVTQDVNKRESFLRAPKYYY